MSIINDYQLRIERWETPRNFTNYEDYIKFRRANMLSPIQQSYFSQQGNMVKEQPISRASSSATLSISGSLSQNQLVSVSSKSAFYRRRNSAERRLILIVSALVILAIILLIALVVVTYIYLQSERVDLCSSKECVQSAANLMASMDETVDPCDDFYKFACGRWGLEHAIPDSALSHDWFTEKQSDMMRTIRDYLKEKNSESDPFPVTQARTMFEACMNLDQLEALGLQPMMAIIDKVGLSRHPPISAAGAGDPKATSWMNLVVNAKKMLSMEVLVGIGIFSDPSDGTINRINVGAPETKSPLPSGSKSMDHHIDRQRRVESAVDEMTANELTYVKYIADVMTYLENGEQGAKRDFKEAANKIERFEKILWRELDADTSVDITVVTIAELQTLSDSLATPTSISFDWTSYLTLMFDDVENTTLDASNETVVVRNARYLGKMMELVANTPAETLHLYIWWNVVFTLTPHTNRYLRDLRHNYIQQVSGDEMAPLTRSMFCAGAVNQMMGMAVSYAIAKPDFVNTTRVKVHEMLADIRTAFEDLVRGLDWMDGDTKMATMEKANIMRSLVGFPDWLLVDGELDKEYMGVEVNASTYMNNMVDILQKSVTTMLGNLRKENAVNNSDSWITVPTDVNAYYTFQTNSINVPVAILQFPFYGLGLEALNYGAIGSILGHELTHGFDNSGRQYDKDGRMRQWWSNQTVDEYVSRTSCFVEQYGKYGLDGIKDKVDGNLTLGENIADNGGLREALGAYRNYVSRHGEEPRLPGLQKYSNEQLFYVAFANLWCSSWTVPSLPWMLKDEHSPNPVRVKGVLANSPEFAQIWQCPKGAPMNPEPENRCRLW